MYFKLNMAPVVYEITHILAQSQNSHSLGEGFSCFIQDMYGRNPAPQTFGAPIISLSREYISNKKIIESIGVEGDLMTNFTQEERSGFYLLSHSFTKYLIDEYGIEKFLKMYNSKDLNAGYKSQYGKRVDELKNEWVSYIMAQEPFEYSYREWVERFVK